MNRELTIVAFLLKTFRLYCVICSKQSKGGEYSARGLVMYKTKPVLYRPEVKVFFNLSESFFMVRIYSN